MHDQHGVGHHAGRVLCGTADGGVVQVQLRDGFAGGEFEIGDGKVAFHRRGKFGGSYREGEKHQ